MTKRFREILRIPITVIPYLGMDGAGDKTYGNPVETTCYAEEKITEILDNNGQKVLSNITFYVESDIDITPYDLLVYFGTEYPIKAVSAIRELDGTCVLWVVNV
ncbi:MAG: hypothetical protein GX664_03900 [Bacteroidales bacterium]|nr:hypothetical protein [Bacteroidales bacterium]